MSCMVTWPSQKNFHRLPVARRDSWCPPPYKFEKRTVWSQMLLLIKQVIWEGWEMYYFKIVCNRMRSMSCMYFNFFKGQGAGSYLLLSALRWGADHWFGASASLPWPAVGKPPLVLAVVQQKWLPDRLAKLKAAKWEGWALPFKCMS